MPRTFHFSNNRKWDFSTWYIICTRLLTHSLTHTLSHSLSLCCCCSCLYQMYLLWRTVKRERKWRRVGMKCVKKIPTRDFIRNCNCIAYFIWSVGLCVTKMRKRQSGNKSNTAQNERKNQNKNRNVLEYWLF